MLDLLLIAKLKSLISLFSFNLAVTSFIGSIANKLNLISFFLSVFKIYKIKLP